MRSPGGWKCAARCVRWIRESLPVRAAVLLVLAAGAVIVFADLAEDVLERETVAFDRAVALAIHGLDAPLVDAVMRAFSACGSAVAVLPVVAVVAAWGFARGERETAGVFLAVAALAEVLNVVLKHLFHRARPALFEEIPSPQSFSFPSSHAMLAAAVYGMAGFVLARLRPRLRTPLAVATPALVLLIGASRVYLGVHWPTDVLAGFAAGALVLVAGVLALGRAGRSGASRVGNAP